MAYNGTEAYENKPVQRLITQRCPELMYTLACR